jgi:hypothetical protein
MILLLAPLAVMGLSLYALTGPVAWGYVGRLLLRGVAIAAALTLAIAVAILVAATAHAEAAQKSIPAWHKAIPGSAAFLGDDGGGVDTLTVCDTADRYRDWLDENSPPGCQTFQHGLRAIVEVIIFDPARDIVKTGSDNVGFPIAKIHIPLRNFVGYVHLDALHPVVPPNTVINFEKRK